MILTSILISLVGYYDRKWSDIHTGVSLPVLQGSLFKGDEEERVGGVKWHNDLLLVLICKRKIIVLIYTYAFIPYKDKKWINNVKKKKKIHSNYGKINLKYVEFNKVTTTRVIEIN